MHSFNSIPRKDFDDGAACNGVSCDAFVTATDSLVHGVAALVITMRLKQKACVKEHYWVELRFQNNCTCFWAMHFVLPHCIMLLHICHVCCRAFTFSQACQ